MTTRGPVADVARAIQRTLQALRRGEEGIVEVRTFSPEGPTFYGYFDHTHDGALIDAVTRRDGGASIYVTLNPIVPAALARSANRLKRFRNERVDVTTRDGDILRRRWWFIDCDAGQTKGVSATAGEKAGAVALRDSVVAWLSEFGCPEPVLSDSGNGAHALYAIDLPNSEEITGLIRQALRALAARFGDGPAKIDGSVFNASRITKLYGTIAVVGDSTPDRPHRRSAITRAPDPLELATEAQLRALAALAPAEALRGPGPARLNGASPRASDIDIVAIFKEHGRYERPLGNGKHAVRCPFETDGQSHKSTASSTVIFEPTADKPGWGFHCFFGDCAGRSVGDVLRALAGAAAPPGGGERTLDREFVPSKTGGRAAIIVRASEVTPETLSWLWPGRLAVGALTNVVGLPDQGKSLIYTDLAARVSTGSPMPPDPRRPGALPAHRVLILTQEDSPATTVVPRLVKAGADLTRIDLLQMVRDADGQVSIVTLGDDLDVLEAVLTSGQYGLLIVDGIAGYLGANAKTHNDADVRRVLMPFAALLDRMKVAGLSVMHPPKAVTNLAYFAGGSVAFSAIPRVTLGVAADPDDDGPTPRRFLGKLKGNLYGRVPTLAYQIKAESDAGVPWLEWAPGAVAVDLATVFDPPREAPEERGPRRACEEWLRAFLADGPRHSIDVEKAAQAAGFKARTLRRARERVTDSVKAGTDRWDWILRREDVR